MMGEQLGRDLATFLVGCLPASVVVTTGCTLVGIASGDGLLGLGAGILVGALVGAISGTTLAQAYGGADG